MVAPSTDVESMAFGPLQITFDDRVLRPRPWTLAQAEWALELLPDAPDGPVLELCAGAGQMGLAVGAHTDRDLVLVDANEVACEFATSNAEHARLAHRVDVRAGDMREALKPGERFALVIADPPWVPTHETNRFPEDPFIAIDGGEDGLMLARMCVDVIGGCLLDDGVAILQLGDMRQALAIERYVSSYPDLGLSVGETRRFGDQGVLTRIGRRTEHAVSHGNQ